MGRVRRNSYLPPFCPAFKLLLLVYHQRGLSEAWMCGSDPMEMFKLIPSTQNGGHPLDQVNLLSPVLRDFVRGRVSASA